VPVEIYILVICPRLHQHGVAVGRGVYALLYGGVIEGDVDDGGICGKWNIEK
jgi:hypothetical protein